MTKPEMFMLVVCALWNSIMLKPFLAVVHRVCMENIIWVPSILSAFYRIRSLKFFSHIGLAPRL